MKLKPIMEHLYNNLPFNTSKFTDNISCAAAVSTNLVTMTTSSPHGLSTGNKAIITGAKSGLSINIAESSIDGNVVTFKTNDKHNLVMNFNYDTLLRTPTIVELSGFSNAFYNGVKNIKSIPNKNTFIIEFASTPPSIGGAPIAYDGTDRGINGTKTVTVINSTKFSYSVTGTPEVPTGSIFCHLRTRIAGAINSGRIEDLYTAQNANSYWLFVGEATDSMSKDRNIQSDATTERHGGVSIRSRLIDNFSCFVAAPADNDLTARKVHDDIEDVKIALFRTLIGFTSPEQYTYGGDFDINYLGSDSPFYDTAKIIREFKFQTQYDVTLTDTFINKSYVSAKAVTSNFNDDKLISNYNLNEDGT